MPKWPRPVRTCDRDEVCVHGDCMGFDPALLCDACPCDMCGNDNCCQYPGDPGLIVCVDGDQGCPQ